MRRTAFVTRLAAVATLVASSLAQAAVPTCVGSDLLDEFARNDPASYERILQAAASFGNAEARLWRVERSGTEPSFLLGTLHSTDPRITALSPALTSALDRTATVAIEIADPSSTAMLEVFSSNPSLVMFTDGQSLPAKLTSEEMETVRIRLESSGLQPELIASLRPWFAYTLLSLPDCERDRKAQGLKVLDLVIADEGRRRGHAIVGLESVEEQLSALAAVSDQEQMAMLRTAVRWSPRATDMLESVQQRYLRREMHLAWPLHVALAAKAGYAGATFGSFKSKVLSERNVLMRDRSLPLLAKGRALIAVGALHLVGNTGLVSLFREAGYTVTAIE